MRPKQWNDATSSCDFVWEAVLVTKLCSQVVSFACGPSKNTLCYCRNLRKSVCFEPRPENLILVDENNLKLFTLLMTYLTQCSCGVTPRSEVQLLDYPHTNGATSIRNSLSTRQMAFIRGWYSDVSMGLKKPQPVPKWDGKAGSITENRKGQ